MSVVIAGGGLGGLKTAEALRQYGYEERIIIVGAEGYRAYNRTLLSKELLHGTTSLDAVENGLASHDLDVEWRLDTSVVASDLDGKNVTLNNGERLEFEALVGATGVSARRLPIEGPTVGRTTLRTIEDAKAVTAALTPGSHLVILGAGFIGCEVALAAKELGCEVDVIALDPAPMTVPLGEKIGKVVQERHEKAGIRFHMGRTIKRTSGHDRVDSVELDDGTVLNADLLLETVGSVPNIGWLEGNDLDLSMGVVTDEKLRMGGRKGVVAVGDIARFPNRLFGSTPLRVEHWQTAIDTAAVAASTIMYDLRRSSTEPEPIQIMPWFWSDQGSVKLTSYGVLGIADSIEVVEGDLASDCVIAYRRADETLGYLLIGMKRKGARYKRQLVSERKAALLPAHY